VCKDAWLTPPKYSKEFRGCKCYFELGDFHYLSYLVTFTKNVFDRLI
jgi:hypothetical protein